MIVFSHRQWQRIADARHPGFVEALLDELQALFPRDFEMTDRSTVRTEVEIILDETRRWGITRGDLMFLHVYACRVLGRDYLAYARFAAEVLQSTELDEGVRFIWMREWLIAMHAADQRHAIPGTPGWQP